MLVYSSFLLEGWFCLLFICDKDIQIMNYWSNAGGQVMIVCILFTGPNISHVAVGRGGLSTAQGTVI